MYKMENVLCNVHEAGSSWKVGDKKRKGRTEEEKGIEAELNARRKWRLRELGMEGKRVVGGRGVKGAKSGS